MEDVPTLTRNKIDYSNRLPEGWKDNLLPEDQQWVGSQLFAKKGELVSSLKMWWHPPQPPGPKSTLSVPSAGSYFLRRLFLWMPRKMWHHNFTCPNCSDTSLTSKGVYNRVRTIVDLKDQYYLATEYLECRSCKGTFLSYDSRLMDNLPTYLRICFPIVLTRKYACDVSVVALMGSRSIGNSPTALRKDLNEIHTDEWIRKCIVYLSNCKRHKENRFAGQLLMYQHPPEFRPVPSPKWFLAVYLRDVWSRLPILKASASSVYGNILKIASKKKITKKLQGFVANSATWCTNVGNENGAVLLSLLTTSENLSNVEKMANGLMARYEKANVSPPHLLYTDRDCCKIDGPSKLNRLFFKWTDLKIRIDSWHFMRRLAKTVVNESHPLYGTFMCSISKEIFEWDPKDVNLLTQAKKEELEMAGISNPPPGAVKRAITKKELAKHCKRRTRGSEQTILLLNQLFQSMKGKTDTLGVPLLREDYQEVWEEQKRHVSCVQDPDGVPLYTKVGQLTKGRTLLPVYRCARGTTSLESFHLHLKNFIPGMCIFK